MELNGNTSPAARAQDGAAARRKTGRQQRYERRMAYLFVSPQILGLLVFFLFPAAMSVYLCFVNWDMVGIPTFVGMDNFKEVFADAQLTQSLTNTGIFVFGIVPLTTLIALGLALATNRPIRGLGFYKAAFYLPQATASVAIVLVWYWLLAPDIGLFNYFLSLFGIQGPGWLIDTFWAKLAIMLMTAWQGMGYYFLILLAGLKGISADYYEAADIDGANKRQKFFRITLPMLSTALFFVLITMTIGVFNLFQEPMILTEGGPAFSTYTITMYIYDLAFKYFRMGEAAVASLVLLVVVIFVTILQFRMSKRWVYYND